MSEKGKKRKKREMDIEQKPCEIMPNIILSLISQRGLRPLWLK